MITQPQKLWILYY